jgi:hypothetical protein
MPFRPCIWYGWLLTFKGGVDDQFNIGGSSDREACADFSFRRESGDATCHDGLFTDADVGLSLLGSGRLFRVVAGSGSVRNE